MSFIDTESIPMLSGWVNIQCLVDSLAVTIVTFSGKIPKHDLSLSEWVSIPTLSGSVTRHL